MGAQIALVAQLFKKGAKVAVHSRDWFQSLNEARKVGWFPLCAIIVNRLVFMDGQEEQAGGFRTAAAQPQKVGRIHPLPLVSLIQVVEDDAGITGDPGIDRGWRRRFGGSAGEDAHGCRVDQRNIEVKPTAI